MRTIGTLANEKVASRFRDFLYVRGIENELEAEEDGTYRLWVMDEAHVKPAADLFARFQANPDAGEFSAAIPAAETKRREQAKAVEAQRSTVADAARIGYERAYRGVPYVTYALMVISVAVAIYSGLGANHTALRPLSITQFTVGDGFIELVPGLPEVRSGQIWRLVTPIFIHFSLMHIVFNLLLLKDLGTFIESRFSAGYMLSLVVVTAALSNYGQYLWKGPSFGGMSGVDYALFGFLWIRGKYDRRSNWQLNKNTVYMLIGWFVLCLVGIIPQVANGAHGVGLAAGMLWGFGSAKRPFSR